MTRISFDDLDTDINAAPVERLDIRANASIVNGGERAMTACVKCGGSGQTRWGICFRCNGNGQITVRSAAASKAKATKLANQEQWAIDNAAEISYVRRRADKGSNFYAGFLVSLEAYGTWTEKQVAIVHADMVKDAAFFEAKRAERAAAAPVIEMSAIEALFAIATNNDIKRPIFRADGLEISLAPATGKNAGALYVKAEGAYQGKIVGGRFQAVREAQPDTAARLVAIAADPLAESIKYARKTGNCGCCGKTLVDPVSIRSGIGPICANKWGLDYRRDLARDELRREG